VGKIQLYLNEHPVLRKYVMTVVNGGIEWILIAMFLVYALNYFYGVNRNLNLSEKWIQNVRPVIFNNFAVAGTEMDSI
jgi:hypothetical protein